MELILKENVIGLGYKDDIVNVKSGYGRNYLLPRKLAVEATADNVNTMRMNDKATAERQARERAEALDISKRLKDITVTVACKGGGAGRLFGSVTSQEISDSLKAQTGIEIDRRRIVIPEAIKTVGQYTVKCKLGYEISGDLKLNVVEQ